MKLSLHNISIFQINVTKMVMDSSTSFLNALPTEDVISYPAYITTAVDSPPDVSTAIDCTLYRYIIYGPLVVVVSILGLIGNTLACVVLWEDRRKSSTALLLICLAVIDNFVLVSYTVILAIRRFATDPATYWPEFVNG